LHEILQKLQESFKARFLGWNCNFVSKATIKDMRRNLVIEKERLKRDPHLALQID
jgi:hypothetical protein